MNIVFDIKVQAHSGLEAKNHFLKAYRLASEYNAVLLNAKPLHEENSWEYKFKVTSKHDGLNICAALWNVGIGDLSSCKWPEVLIPEMNVERVMRSALQRAEDFLRHVKDSTSFRSRKWMRACENPIQGTDYPYIGITVELLKKDYTP